MKRYQAAESVTKGHPDKLCAQISDAILDAHLKETVMVYSVPVIRELSMGMRQMKHLNSCPWLMSWQENLCEGLSLFEKKALLTGFVRMVNLSLSLNTRTARLQE